MDGVRVERALCVAMTSSEPVAISVAAGAVVSTLVAFVAVLWPDRMTPAIAAAVIALANAAIALIVAVVARSRVTPVASPNLPLGTIVDANGTRAVVRVI